MKPIALVVVLGSVALGFALGARVPVSAQPTTPGAVAPLASSSTSAVVMAPQRWEQTCVVTTVPSGIRWSDQAVQRTLDELVRRNGQSGWELASHSQEGTVYTHCFKRPAR